MVLYRQMGLDLHYLHCCCQFLHSFCIWPKPYLPCVDTAGSGNIYLARPYPSKLYQPEPYHSVEKHHLFDHMRQPSKRGKIHCTMTHNHTDFTGNCQQQKDKMFSVQYALSTKCAYMFNLCRLGVFCHLEFVYSSSLNSFVFCTVRY